MIKKVNINYELFMINMYDIICELYIIIYTVKCRYKYKYIVMW